MILQWPWTIKYFLALSPTVKRWQMARTIAHNQAVRDYWRRIGLDATVASIAPKELEFQEVVEEGG